MTGDSSLNINVAKIVGTLLGAQLLPLGAGLWLRRQYPTWADTLKRPATLLSTLLNLVTLGVILFLQFRVLIGIRLVSYLGMLLLVIATVAAGWVSGRNMNENQKSMVLTTGVRNVGVGLVIVSSSFPGTAAISAAIAFALFQTIALSLIASAWGAPYAESYRSTVEGRLDQDGASRLNEELPTSSLPSAELDDFVIWRIVRLLGDPRNERKDGIARTSYGSELPSRRSAWKALESQRKRCENYICGIYSPMIQHERKITAHAIGPLPRLL